MVQLSGYMAPDALAALVVGMAAAHSGDLSKSADRGLRRFSLSSAPAAEPGEAAVEALGAEIWGLMEILTENLYDPDEQVRPRSGLGHRHHLLGLHTLKQVT